jgi:hypothetical protein
MHPPPSVQLALAKIRLATGAPHSQERNRPERIELSEDKRRLEVSPSVAHGFIDRARPQHLLAPEIVESIIAGRADQSLVLEELERPLPTHWDEQRDHLRGPD